MRSFMVFIIISTFYENFEILYRFFKFNGICNVEATFQLEFTLLGIIRDPVFEILIWLVDAWGILRENAERAILIFNKSIWICILGIDIFFIYLIQNMGAV